MDPLTLAFLAKSAVDAFTAVRNYGQTKRDLRLERNRLNREYQQGSPSANALIATSRAQAASRARIARQGALAQVRGRDTGAQAGLIASRINRGTIEGLAGSAAEAAAENARFRNATQARIGDVRRAQTANTAQLASNLSQAGGTALQGIMVARQEAREQRRLGLTEEQVGLQREGLELSRAAQENLRDYRKATLGFSREQFEAGQAAAARNDLYQKSALELQQEQLQAGRESSLRTYNLEKAKLFQPQTFGYSNTGFYSVRPEGGVEILRESMTPPTSGNIRSQIDTLINRRHNLQRDYDNMTPASRALADQQIARLDLEIQFTQNPILDPETGEPDLEKSNPDWHAWQILTTAANADVPAAERLRTLTDPNGAYAQDIGNPTFHTAYPQVDEVMDALRQQVREERRAGVQRTVEGLEALRLEMQERSPGFVSTHEIW